MIIDFHVHCFPDDLAAKAVPALAAAAGETAYTDGTISDLKRSMDEAGIDISVLQPVATRPGQVEGINNWLEDVIDNRIAAFGAMHPDLELRHVTEALERITDMGLRGVKLHPDYQDFFVDEERLSPMYEEIFSRGLYILFHAGVDIGLRPPYHCTPDRLAVLLERFPEARVIAAHMGGFAYWDTVEYMLIGREIYLDTSYAIDYLGTERMSYLIRGQGAEKILFATDSPWAEQAEELEAIDDLELDRDERKLVLGDNAARILEI
ncbi:MAG: amidohydrolase family protein [bacterium]|nr:amidohydrolase family protein [bacterium]